MKVTVTVNESIVRANAADGKNRPVLDIETPLGTLYHAVALTGKGFSIRTQQSHPDPMKPAAWIELDTVKADVDLEVDALAAQYRSAIATPGIG